ncbi:ABC transporter substrate-binding protein [Nafulsella turpanensis]|uniref:ABC transporter substrate-binding protein n=1 Tax=Nafulsella turpanensis TaxID=1265690 RepID=UPI000476990A|nr:ABC transporter substrate-binding protein [Nafulsella turpanensis]
MLRQFCAYLMAVLLITAGCTATDNALEDGNAKVFRYNQAEGLSSLDPAFARNQANVWAITNLYSGLFELSPDMYPIPDMVDSWEVSEDGGTYTFNLKKGIRFHDSEVFEGGKGREVTAEDFEYSFKRLLDPATASTGAWIFNDKVKKNEAGDGFAENWVEATDKYTLVLRLEKPFGPFLEILTMPYTFAVPKEAVEKWGKDFRKHPVGTGPFQLKSWDEGNSLIMVKNPNYWKDDANGQQLPYLDAVMVSFIQDRNQELLTFQQGKLDFMSGVEANSIDLILDKDGAVKEEIKGKFVVQKVPYLNTEYIGFQLDPSVYKGANHPILNKDFRKAMNYAINREEMLKYLFNNLGTPGKGGIIPPAIKYFKENTVKGYTYDPAKAEELLKTAGYPGGKGLPTIKLNTTVQSKPMVEYLQKQWGAVGIPVEIEINQTATHQELIDNSRANFFRGSWLGDYPDAENYLAMFYSKYFSPAGPNKTHFNNSEFDKLYEKARYESEGFNRLDLYHKMDQIIMEEAPVIVLFYDEVVRLTQNNVTGLEPNPMNVLDLERASFVDGEVIQE